MTPSGPFNSGCGYSKRRCEFNKGATWEPTPIEIQKVPEFYDLFYSKNGSADSTLGGLISGVSFECSWKQVGLSNTWGIVAFVQSIHPFLERPNVKFQGEPMGIDVSAYRATYPKYAIPFIVNLGQPYMARTKLGFYDGARKVNLGPESSLNIGFKSWHKRSVLQYGSNRHAPYLNG